MELDFKNFKKHKDYSFYEDKADEEAEQDSLRAQDMIAEIQKKHNCSVEEAIKLAVTPSNAKRTDAGYARFAFDDWGHGDGRGRGYGDEKPFQTIDTPIVRVSFSQEQVSAINRVSANYDVDATMAVCYMLIFEMENMEYHI